MFRLFLVVSFFSLLLPVSASAKTTLLLATDVLPDDPYIVGDGTEFNHDLPGIEVELYRLVAERLNLSLKFLRLPWKRGMIQLEQGEIDGLFPAAYAEQRLNFAVYPMEQGMVSSAMTLRKHNYHLYKHRDSLLSWDGVTVTGVETSIYAPLGWLIVQDLKKMNVPVTEIYDISRAFKLLSVNRIAGFACPEAVANYYKNKHPELFTHVEQLQPVVKESPYYLIFSHRFVERHPGLAEQIWQTIVEIKNSDVYRQLLKKYRVQ